ncbi:BTB/POZ protein [Rhizophagus irregularis DAOM 181602=DAOM 197198]|uniref:BTB/POZ protein n=1 Tax=Rhizophagus irregularis (strain DAOM 181602 / DAOM 197198 / MUCL 43194) TaxID=747089 RepID=A0A2P4R011_RHIID|nr:BTB/POZ protein [Rhizophagus irregularis DAOM 181602=DAOM 197198]POG83237.1 BTB/POZ protein [Rhizophagus irregularis DAOM 181602=DAOM 197198]|eukprot:XP_025190103.1 BTB/POZ protein [Rhizophagus irregularis DAOM 181602=DAOM 197198]
MDPEKKRKRENSNEEKVVLNIGGIKYETLQSTLTARPDTLLGTMFQERNQMMLHPTNNNEYFFDRNGRAFHYIMEFYRTGKITWDPINYQHQHQYQADENTICFTVNKQELDEELDYFQIPFTNSKLHQVHAKLREDIDEFVDLIIDLVYEGMRMWEEYILIHVILSLFQDKFRDKLKASLPGLQYGYELVAQNNNIYYCLELTPNYKF